MRSSLIAVSLTLIASTLAGQTISNDGVPLFAAKLDTARHSERIRSVPFRSQAAQRYAPLASVIIPGSGQYMLGNDRFIAYVAVEALSWLQYAKNVREQADQEAEFKSLARKVARASFASGSLDDLPDGDWAYYEKMRDFDESGSYSLTTGGQLSPETNPLTYNGSRWQLAQSTYSTRESALAEYMRTAVRPEFEWSWKNANLEYDRFKRTTDKRNDAARAGFLNLMVIGANHALSMIDAFTTVRLRTSTDAAGATSLGMSIAW